MKLQLSQVKALAKGVMDVTVNAGVFTFHRLNDAQKGIYAPNTGGWRRSQALASVHLDMVTDATELCFTSVNAWNSTGVRNYYFDLFIDGQLRFHDGFSYEPNEDGTTMRRFEDRQLWFFLGKGTKRLQLYMPAICHAELRDIELVGATFANPVPSKYRWLAFGDSITEAHSSPLPSMQYTEQAARVIDAEVLNQGTGGEMYMAKRIVPGSYPKVDFITVAYGTNDYRHSPGKEEFLTQLRGFYKALHEEFGNTPVLVLLPLWRKLEETNDAFEIGTLDQVRQVIREEAEKYPANRVVDCKGFIPPVLDFFADKGLHPNALGHTFYAQGLIPEIQKILK